MDEGEDWGEQRGFDINMEQAFQQQVLGMMQLAGMMMGGGLNTFGNDSEWGYEDRPQSFNEDDPSQSFFEERVPRRYYDDRAPIPQSPAPQRKPTERPTVIPPHA